MKNLLNKFIILSIIFVGFAFFSSVANAQNSGEVTLNGEVNPNGAHTTAWFEWGDNPSLSTWNETKHLYIGANDYTTPISANLSGLNPRQTYYFRIVTDNGYRISKGNILSFKTSTTSTKNNYVSTNTTNTKTTVKNNYVGYTRNTGNYTDYRENSNYQNRYYTNQAATPLFGAAFLPNNGFSILLLVLVIIAIILVTRRLISDRD